MCKAATAFGTAEQAKAYSPFGEPAWCDEHRRWHPAPMSPKQRKLVEFARTRGIADLDEAARTRADEITSLGAVGSNGGLSKEELERPTPAPKQELPEGFDPHRMCFSKSVYSNPEAALRSAMKRMRSDDSTPTYLRTYKCPLCPGYHLTSARLR